jgi:hypothetical protein
VRNGTSEEYVGWNWWVEEWRTTEAELTYLAGAVEFAAVD